MKTENTPNLCSTPAAPFRHIGLGIIFRYRMYGINSYIDSFTLIDIGQNNHLILSWLLYYILVKGLCDQLSSYYAICK